VTGNEIEAPSAIAEDLHVQGGVMNRASSKSLAQRLHIAALVVAGVLGAMTAGLAQAKDAAPAALVTELSGTVEPPLALRQEIVPGTRIKVNAGSKVSLLHYAACSVVTVTGGTVTVTASGVESSADAQVSNKPGPCPRVHRLATAGAGPLSGAMVMRGGARLQFSPALDLTLTGSKAADAVSADILDREHKPVQTAVPIQDGLVRLSTPLQVGQSYLLALKLRGRTEPLEVSFVVSNSTSQGPSIFRLE
jgi:hypothetical protein